MVLSVTSVRKYPSMSLRKGNSNWFIVAARVDRDPQFMSWWVCPLPCCGQTVFAVARRVCLMTILPNDRSFFWNVFKSLLPKIQILQVKWQHPIKSTCHSTAMLGGGVNVGRRRSLRGLLLFIGRGPPSLHGCRRHHPAGGRRSSKYRAALEVHGAPMSAPDINNILKVGRMGGEKRCTNVLDEASQEGKMWGREKGRKWIGRIWNKIARKN